MGWLDYRHGCDFQISFIFLIEIQNLPDLRHWAGVVRQHDDPGDLPRQEERGQQPEKEDLAMGFSEGSTDEGFRLESQ